MDDIEVTAPELGDWLGLTDRSVRDLAADGTIPRSRRGRYPLKACVRAYCAHAREIAAGRASQDGELDIVAERARLAKEQADKLEMENATSRGELLPRAEVVSALQAVFARCRARLLSLPTKLAPLIVGEPSPAVVQDRITQGVHEALDELKSLKLVSIEHFPCP